ncbi:transposase, partial [Aquipuribacter sp. MA13-6]|uniref:transposase n=1 Tax=unclassified Aquipuribacter TaxID=2635084 RepID=UPI003EEA4D50
MTPVQVRRRALWLWHHGAFVDDVAAAVGVSSTSVGWWVSKVGGVVAGAEPEPPSGRYLTVQERETIALMWAAKRSRADIARELGRHRSTIGRELDRNRTLKRDWTPSPDGLPRPRGPVPGRSRPHPDDRLRYRALNAQSKADKRAQRPKARRLATDRLLRARVEAGLRLRWSPEQISRRLRQRYPDVAEMHVSHETIYQAL